MNIRSKIAVASASLVGLVSSAHAELPAGVEAAFGTLMTDFGLLATAAAAAIVGIPVALKGYALFKRVWAKV